MSEIDDSLQEQEIVAKAQKDPEYFSFLYEKYVDRIYSYIFHRVFHEEIAQDLVAQTFYKALKNISKFQWRGFPFSSWLYKIASNEVNQYFRRVYDKQYVDIDLLSNFLSGGSDPSQDAVEEDERRILSVSLRKLSQGYQEVLILRFVEGLSNKEIGLILHKKEGAVRQIVFRALNALRSVMKNNS